MNAKIVGGMIAVFLAAGAAFAQPPSSVPTPARPPVAIVPNPPSATILPSRTPPPTPEDIAKGLAIAKLLNSEANTRVIIEKMVDNDMAAAMAADPTFQRGEKDHPGLLKAVLAAMRPILLKGMMDDMPGIWNDIGAIFSNEMTSSELDATLAWYRSPTGVKTTAGVAENVDAGPTLQSVIHGDGQAVAGAEIDKAAKLAALSAIGGLSPAEMVEYLRFAISPAGRKLVVIVPLVKQNSMNRLNMHHPAMDAEIKVAISATITKFLLKPPK